MAYLGKPFIVAVQAGNISSDYIEILLLVRNSMKAHRINSNETYKSEFNLNPMGSANNFTLDIILFKDVPIEKGPNERQCSSHKLVVKIEKNVFFTFIQTDKPVYYPNDTVKIRIIVVDKELKPYHYSNINVDILDPMNRTIHRFEGRDNHTHGVLMREFKLNDVHVMGEWRISVNILDANYTKKFKIIPVEKYKMPLFGVDIATSSKNYLPNTLLVLYFSAEYSFNDYVNGDADLVICDIADDKVYYSKTFKNVRNRIKHELIIEKDFNITIFNKMDFRAIVTYTESVTGIKFNKSTEFSVHSDPTVKMIPVHSELFKPGFPFDFKVFMKDWKNDTFYRHDEVEIDFVFTLEDGSKKKEIHRPFLMDGIANQNVLVPDNTIDFNIKCRFLNSKVYRMKVGKDELKNGSKILDIDYFPKL